MPPPQLQGMLKTASVRLLQDGGSWQSYQALLSGYSEADVPLIRRFCSASIGNLTSSKVDGDASYQAAADQPHDNSGCGSEPNHSINVVWKQVMNHGPPKRGSCWKKLQGRDGPTEEECYHEKKLPDTPSQPLLLQTILDAPMSTLITVLDTWVQVGNHLERNEALMVLFHLRKQRLYSKALKFMDWIERRQLLDFEERDYACHLDLVARNHGLEAAQKYIERVPKSFRNEVLYETLLVSCVCHDDVQKGQQVFNEIRELSLPLTVSACNQMIVLYKRTACHKVVDILTLMEKENIKPSHFTYKLLIDLKAQSNDILGMESVLNAMKDNGLEPDFATQTMVAKFYMSGGLTEKAEEVISAMEVYAKDNREATRSLLDLYAILGRPDDVERICNSCTEQAAIEAWGKL